jgi:hypothetical protein
MRLRSTESTMPAPDPRQTSTCLPATRALRTERGGGGRIGDSLQNACAISAWQGAPKEGWFDPGHAPQQEPAA